jgi:hypothetical protein
VHDAPLDEQLAEAAAVGPLDGQRLVERSLRDDAGIEQKPAE